MICRQTRVPGVSVSRVARRHDAKASLVSAWLRGPRLGLDETAVGERAAIRPVEMGAAGWEGCCEGTGAALASEGLIELELAGGHRLRGVGSHDPEALARLMRRP